MTSFPGEIVLTEFPASPLLQKKQSFECRACKNKVAISQMHIPYAAKLLLQVRTALSAPCTVFDRGFPGTASDEHCHATLLDIDRTDQRCGCRVTNFILCLCFYSSLAIHFAFVSLRCCSPPQPRLVLRPQHSSQEARL